jgi:formylglycine-generating enzyme required for sulfatase activity
MENGAMMDETPPPGIPTPRMIEIPAGDFVMGETAGDKFAGGTERPAHRVTISRPFSLGCFPVTTGEYRLFNPRHAPAEDPALPAVNVTWDEAHAYCAWLSGETGHQFRLPTEAEWEYACRAGAREPFAWGALISPRDANFLHDENCVRVGPGRRTPAGAYPPNAFGLYDMHGNVCEWVADAWRPDYFGAPDDGSARFASPDEQRRVIRGGAWDYMPRLLRAAWRDWLPRGSSRDNVGFRIAR